MKISVISAQVFPAPPSGYSGLEMIAWQQARCLALRGHQVALFAPHGSHCPGVQMIHTGMPGWDERVAYGGDPKAMWNEGGEVRVGWPGYWMHLLQSEVIIDNSWQKNAYLLKQEGKLPAPVLGVLHAPVNTMMQCLPPGVPKPCFVAISEDQAEHFRNLFSHDAKVAYNGCDANFYSTLNLPRTQRFLFLARFSSIKGPDLAIQACKDAGVGLDLIGDTSITNEPALLQKCMAMADGEQIRMIGPATRGECVWWFSRAHALLHPAGPGWREPFGLSPVEAQLCGCPVVAMNAGALRETTYRCEKFANLCEPTYEAFVAAIRAAKDGITASDRLRCRSSALAFTVERMAARYEALCLEAIKTGGW